jgi:hypothetical protein
MKALLEKIPADGGFFSSFILFDFRNFALDERKCTV